MGFYEIGLAAFIVVIVIGQFLLQRASAQLSIEDRAKLVDLHGGLNTYWLLILLPLFGLYWYLSGFTELPLRLVSIGFFVVTFGLLIFILSFNYRKIAKLGFPSHYVSTYLVSQGVYLVGTTVFLATMVYKFF